MKRRRAAPPWPVQEEQSNENKNKLIPLDLEVDGFECRTTFLCVRLARTTFPCVRLALKLRSLRFHTLVCVASRYF
jgi:hypothetical protein